MENIKTSEILNTENKILNKTKSNLETLKKEVTVNLNNLFKYEKNSDTLSIFSDMYSRILKNLDKNLYSPYFAKIQYKDNNEDKMETLYIGKVGFASLDEEKEYIVDWRAPISQLYYNAKLGNCSYCSLDKVFHGHMSLKRQFDIKDKSIIAFYDHEDLISNDDFLKPYLTTSADNRLKSIVSTIQSEQDNIIRQPIFKNLIVQGVAGSGKTTVALHRLSYLVYTYEKKIKTNQYLILAPNKIFLNYISGILPDLDVGDAQESTIEEFALKISSIKANFQNKHAVYNKLASQNKDFSFLYYKSSIKFMHLINKFLSDYIEKEILKPIIIKNIELISKQEVIELFYSINESSNLTIKLEILSKIIATKLLSQQYIIKINKACLEKDMLSLAEKNKIISQIEKGYQTQIYKTFVKKQFDILNIYKYFIENFEKYCDLDFKSELKEVTLKNIKNKTLGFDDIGAILYLSYKILNLDKSNISHIFIDEAQDLGELIYYSLHKIFDNAHFSIFGDLTQGIYEFQGINSWQSTISNCFENDAELIEMNKSYRTTIEIMQEANKLSGLLGYAEANNVLRHGTPVQHKTILNHREDILNSIDMLTTQGCKSIAIICKDEQELEKCKILLKDYNISLCNENDDIYNSGTCMITVQTAKGLEFDGVIIFDKQSYNLQKSLEIKYLYVAETRALHHLIVLQSC